MDGLHITMAFFASAILSSFTDWYFFGVLFHDRYGNTPGIWKKYKDKADEIKSITISEVILSLSSLVFILVCSHLNLLTFEASICSALVTWIMVPVPLLMTNAIYIPMDRLIVLSHALGWLSRLVITALCVSCLG
jgi:hypothetical protein